MNLMQTVIIIRFHSTTTLNNTSSTSNTQDSTILNGGIKYDFDYHDTNKQC